MCHVGGEPGNRYRGSGAPSYYLEQHVWLHMPVERLAMSLICEGVFDEFPRLQVALVEACLTWSGPLQWAMDAAYEVAGNDAPRLRKLPSEYFREHFWLSTQPVEEPDNPRHLTQSIEFARMTDRVMFSSDYPHWDFDSPAKALPAAMPAEMRRKIMGENAARLYARRLGRG
jgi:predicted TIM-barrel fold metal-dependent hydrolase